MMGTERFEQYADDVYGWAYRLLGHHHDALDVVQDVYLKWAGQCSRKAPKQPRSWLRRVTLNRAIDLRRNRRTVPAQPDRQAQSTPSQTAPDGCERIDTAALREDVAAAMARLTDAQREVLVAKIYDAATFREIAEELGLAVSTVKTHYLRAVRAVRDRLRPRWQDEGSS